MGTIVDRLAVDKLVGEYKKYLEQGLTLREEIEKYMSERIKSFCEEYNARFSSGNGVWGCKIKVDVSNNVEAIINLNEVFSPVSIYDNEDWNNGGTGNGEKLFSPEEWE